MKRKLPKPGTKAAGDFCRVWDDATHAGKLGLATLYEVGYQVACNHRSTCQPVPVITEPVIEPDASFEDYISVMKAMDKLTAIHHYIPTEINIQIDTDKPIGITFTADWQLGEFGVDLDAFGSDMKVIRDEPGLKAYIGGDSNQNMIQPSKIGSSHNQTPISVQHGATVRAIQYLGDKVLALGTGNHNHWSYLATGEDWVREVARKLKVVYTEHAGIINLTLGNQTYQIARMHQSRFNSSFNLTHACKQHQRLDFPNARVMVAEHNHVGDVEQYRYNDRECVAVRTGTYAVYDAFARSHGFFGSHVCNPTVIFYPDQDRLVGFKDMKEAIIYLRAVRGI